jgi:hypothetical protein
MADDRIHDLGPSATSAVGAAYESALQSLPPKACEDYPLLRYWLARHLIAAAFAGEQEPDALRGRAIAYVEKWFRPPVLHGITREPPPSELQRRSARPNGVKREPQFKEGPLSLVPHFDREHFAGDAWQHISRVFGKRPCRFVQRCL